MTRRDEKDHSEPVAVSIQLTLTADEAVRVDSIAARAGVVPLSRDGKKQNNATRYGRKSVLKAAARSFLSGRVPIPEAVAATEYATLDDAGREAVRRCIHAEAGRVQREREAEAFNAMCEAERRAKAARKADVLRRQREQRGNAKHLRRLQRLAEASADWGGSGEAVRLLDGLEFAPM